MRLKDRLKNKALVFGTWCVIPSPEVVNILAKSGLDFVLLDMEHGPADYTTAQRMVMAAEAESCEAIIRVSGNDEAEVLKALDIGASGVIIPHIENAREREKAISYIKYPPAGVRGYSPYTRSGDYYLKSGHTAEENSKTLSGIIIESKTGIENLDEIIDDPALDIVYIGTYDLSVSLGVPGEVKSRTVLKELENCAARILKKGKTAGCLFHDMDEFEYFKGIGIRFLVYKVDTSVLYDGFKFIEKLRD